MSFQQARTCIAEKVSVARKPRAIDVPFSEAAGRVLAEPVRSDRDYPPLARSIRDGYALRADDLPGSFEVIGEVRAGDRFGGIVGPGQAVSIMTGAVVPMGADQVVMLEHTRQVNNNVSTMRPSRPGEFINPRGSEAAAGDILLQPGCLIDYTVVCLLAMVGKATVKVYRKPKVAIVATGDEIVTVAASPREHQVRNSNSYSLAAQVASAGGLADILPVAPDQYAPTRKIAEKALQADLVLFSGGVSAGKYDVVEEVLASFGAEFHFDRTLIQPGQPTVFGQVKDIYFFGLPGNPISTMVTFRVFAQLALELLAGRKQPMLPFLYSRLTKPFKHKTGLTRFLPAELSRDGGELTPIDWQGSSDVPAVARAGAFLVADAGRESWEAGEMMPVLLK